MSRGVTGRGAPRHARNTCRKPRLESELQIGPCRNLWPAKRSARFSPAAHRNGNTHDGHAAKVGQTQSAQSRQSDRTPNEAAPDTLESSWHCMSEKDLATRMMCGELDLFPASHTAEELSHFAFEKLLSCTNEDVVEQLSLQLSIMEHSPVGAAVRRACNKAAAAGERDDIKLRHATAIRKVARMQQDRERKLIELTAAAGQPQIPVNNISVFKSPVQACDEEDPEDCGEKLKAKLQKNEDMISEALQELHALSATPACRRWRRLEREYARLLEESGIGPLRESLAVAVRARGMIANRVGEHFERACAVVVRERLLREEMMRAQRRPGTEVLMLSNVVFRCSMPQQTTAEFDFILVKLREPIEREMTALERLQARHAAAPSKSRLVWPVEVLKVVECKSCPRDVPGDIAAMQRALAFFSGTQGSALPDDAALQDGPPAFSATTVRSSDGRRLLFDSKSFAAERFGSTESIAQHLVYITREGPLGPPKDSIVQLVDHALSMPGFSAFLERSLLDTAGGEGPVPATKELPGGVPLDPDEAAFFLWARTQQEQHRQASERFKELLHAVVQNKNLWLLQRAPGHMP